MVVEGVNQDFKCAAACFGHYRWKANGRIGSPIIMFEGMTGTFEENIQTCGFACMNRRTPAQGDFDDYHLMGFSVNEDGDCYCETSGVVLLDEAWRYYEYILPYKKVTGGKCLLNNKLVYDTSNPNVENNPGRTAQERIEYCARKCQLYFDGTPSIGFSYLESNAQCYCERLDNNCVVADPSFTRYDFTLFNIFRNTENAECRCGRDGGSECFSTLALPDVVPNIFTLKEPEYIYYNFICKILVTFKCFLPWISS